ncbi:hypothetical protein OS189_04235 [Sulfitobacter sp. F26169L]|uniref:hypothetical protein n=1 Tax=Sulfitobacter sp. F26169L TaxID=2996015 RepID=UPI002260F527|nr:hypothetical protein [Sulfitobacter sp. F26169L]MCX7565550.1 hypothetical protein [Sulfitobacter sp. F26169L]
MRISLSVLLVASMSLGACGFVRDSALNPSNWFGRSTSETLQTADAKPANPLIPKKSGLFARRGADEISYAGRPFEEIIDLTVERVPGGAIIRATGRADRQGRYAVQLTPQQEDETPVDGVLTYRFEGVEPARNTAIGGPVTREVTAARKLTDQDLRGVRSIRVEGVRNARVARR